MENLSGTYEYMAPTVEEAIAKGLDELGVKHEEVDIEIIDEGKRNVFRFASRQAHIKLSLRSKPAQPIIMEPNEDVTNDKLSDDEIAQELQNSFVDTSDLEGLVREILVDILEKMSVKSNVSTKKIHNEGDDHEVIYANIEGDDLSFLIGRKSETLNALQYLTGLIVSKKVNHWVPVQVDIQSYRSRRESELKKIAQRMAEQTMNSGKKQFLEPMPANERRIIHMELRNYEHLVSESIGEEPNRKVTISLKK